MNKLTECGLSAYPFNHGLSPIVDGEGMIIKPTNPSFAYWSTYNGSFSCPNWRDKTTSTFVEYWIASSILMFLKIYTCYLQLNVVKFLVAKRRKDNKGKAGKRNHKLCFGSSLTAIFEFSHTLIFVIMLLILGLVDNVNPIYMFFGFNLSLGCYFIGMGLSCWKMIKLGQRILPKHVRGEKIMDNSVANDPILSFCFATLICSWFVAAILLLVVAPLTGDLQFSYLGILFFGVVMESGALLLGRQGIRVVNYMKESNKLVKEYVAIPNEDKSNVGDTNKNHTKNKIDQVMYRIRFRSILVTLIGVPSAVIAILAGVGVIKVYWYIMVVFGYFGVISSFASLIMFLPRDMPLIPCISSRITTNRSISKQIKGENNVNITNSNKNTTPDRIQNFMTATPLAVDADTNSHTTN